ncbi:hypothetical protein ABFU84_02150 [Xanthomonas translucens pv. undulosa]|uniref:hypothetical protein n=1 Tax=Xanthomonas campestris pv. translucens TaxID=343 RepID=UPI003CF5D186
MDVLSLLRLCARLLDLHDAQRLPGNAPTYVQEERAGLRNGHYLDLASLVLDALREFAHDSGNAFTGFDALLIAVRERSQCLDPDDLRYVLNVLARPTELWTIDRSVDKADLVSDKQTNLVERTHYADDYRLTTVGRSAINLASNISSFVYAEGDALKLLRAIEAGDFVVVPAFCDGLLDAIRYASVDLRQEIERGQVDSQSEVFKVKMPRFREVIQKTTELLRQAEAMLRAWRSSGNDDLDETLAIDVFELRQRVLQVYQALEAFGRDLSDLTKLAAKHRVSAVATMDFLEVALNLVKRPPTDRQIVALFRQFGPLSLVGVFPSPIDTAGKVRVAPEKKELAIPFDTVAAINEAPDGRLLFLDQYGDAIKARLEKGPLPLSEALEHGWCELEGQWALPELLGVYFAPWALGSESSIELSVPHEMIDRLGARVGELVFSNLAIAIQERGAVP